MITKGGYIWISKSKFKVCFIVNSATCTAHTYRELKQICPQVWRATTELNLSYYYHSESCILESFSLSNLLFVSPLSPAAHLGGGIGARELFCEVERRPSRRVLHHLY